MNFGLVSLLGALVMAVVSDLYARKVPNLLVLGGILAALAIHAMAAPGAGILEASGGAIGLLSSLGGIAVGFAALVPQYALRAMGAGDVKLMMMVGAFLGPLQTLGVVVLTFVAGGVLAIGMALWQRSFKQLALNLHVMLTTSAVHAATGASPKFEPLQQTAGRMPYAVAIAAGTLLQLYLVRSGGWALS
ncbi:prepilin peptidase [Azoarcus sp. KH32C]|uniref:A24 family peptidase n=1 Tax=Azoarcus sp. KH32C TaxID=748247 RepID=UPI00023867AE|nr:prepilin peptidase [Azoarcus sp. KH32C]BAL26412.1 Flp pilus assembly protein, protease CpaA [Azoarcus sp. KH32C]